MDFVFLVLFVFFVHVSLRWGEGKYTPASDAQRRGARASSGRSGGVFLLQAVSVRPCQYDRVNATVSIRPCQCDRANKDRVSATV